jgi:hypothetical protein
MLGGILLSTILFRLAQTTSFQPAGTKARPYTGIMTDAQKLYIGARSATSELLFKISFATLAALIGLQLSNAQSRVSQRGIFTAAGLLFTSLYAAFLFQVGVSRSMEASLDEMFGAILGYPIMLQFWFLFAALVIIAAALFRNPRHGAAIMAFVALLGAAPLQAETPASRQCVVDWAKSHDIQLPSAAAKDAARVIEILAAKRGLKVTTGNRCAVVTTMLDTVRYTALRDGKPETGAEAGAALAKMLRDARKTAEAPNFSPGELLRQLLSIAEIWTVDSGIFDIDAKDTLFVTVISRSNPKRPQWLGYTRWLLRLPPGSYNVRIADGTRIVFDRTIDLAADARVPIDIR